MPRQITLQLIKEGWLLSQKQLLVWAKWLKWWVVRSLNASSQWFHAPARTLKVQSSLRELLMFGARSVTGSLRSWPLELYRALNGQMVLQVESTLLLRSLTRMVPNGTGVSLSSVRETILLPTSWSWLSLLSLYLPSMVRSLCRPWPTPIKPSSAGTLSTQMMSMLTSWVMPDGRSVTCLLRWSVLSPLSEQISTRKKEFQSL